MKFELALTVACENGAASLRRDYKCKVVPPIGSHFALGVGEANSDGEVECILASVDRLVFDADDPGNPPTIYLDLCDDRFELRSTYEAAEALEANGWESW